MKECLILSVVFCLLVACMPLPSVDTPNETDDPERTDYLIAYYPFDGTIEDISGNAYDGVAVGEPSYIDDTVDGKGKALRLNGFKGQYINIPYAFLHGLEEYSVSFWIKDFTAGMVFSAISSDYVRSDYPRLLITNSQKFRFYTGYDNYDSTAPFEYDCTPIMSEEWHHIALVESREAQTRSDVIKRLYIDGDLINSSESYWSEGASVKINIGGDRNGTYSQGLTAKLDNFRFYGCALKGKDVLYLYDNCL